MPDFKEFKGLIHILDKDYVEKDDNWDIVTKYPKGTEFHFNGRCMYTGLYQYVETNNPTNS